MSSGEGKCCQAPRPAGGEPGSDTTVGKSPALDGKVGRGVAASVLASRARREVSPV